MTRSGAVSVTRRDVFGLAGGASAAAMLGTAPALAGATRADHYPTALIHEVSMATPGFDPSRLVVMHDVMARYVGAPALPGLVTLISRNGETEIQAYGTTTIDGDAPMTPDTIFRLASVMKPIVAAAAMTLVEDCTLRLDDPVDAILPELANRQVLRSLESDLDDTVPADRSITMRDLLTMTPGYGLVFANPCTYPIQQAITDAGLAPGADNPTMSADEMLQRYAELPLLAQPGTRFFYNDGLNLLGILLARATDMPLGDLLQERLFAPLGMVDTGFSVPAAKAARLPAQYFRNPQSGELVEFDPAGAQSMFTSPPAFESGAGGLVSTAADLLAFGEMMLGTGTRGDVRVLSRASVLLMTTNQLTPEQMHAADFFPGFWETHGWGFGLAIDTKRAELFQTPGRYGWDGAYGTSLHIDPAEDMIGVLLTQQAWDGLGMPTVLFDFWNSAYQALA